MNRPAIIPSLLAPPGVALLHGPDGVQAIALGESAPPSIEDAGPAPWAHRTGPCDFRWTRWHCGGAIQALCRLGLGTAGIVEEADCASCDRRSVSHRDSPENG
jgi:hypothetical protein